MPELYFHSSRSERIFYIILLNVRTFFYARCVFTYEAFGHPWCMVHMLPPWVRGCWVRICCGAEESSDVTLSIFVCPYNRRRQCESGQNVHAFVLHKFTHSGVPRWGATGITLCKGCVHYTHISIQYTTVIKQLYCCK